MSSSQPTGHVLLVDNSYSLYFEEKSDLFEIHTLVQEHLVVVNALQARESVARQSSRGLNHVGIKGKRQPQFPTPTFHFFICHCDFVVLPI
ncbi:hypothetical protein BpHYR1_051806 [Brachionus plicatilis]|uniref:Uncharacterized protein n=1 Tax=Brachionus plicatilis TaxID=10195 RepID=A0A3M7P9G8_BRAPC|nr:hypothetical protein BpHYR1_051806 [Brachionus plicatilis]